jgi:hypothetical protein
MTPKGKAKRRIKICGWDDELLHPIMSLRGSFVTLTDYTE